MKKSYLIALFVFPLFLFGCGGGGSSSGGGGAAVGTYKGTITYSGTGPGGTASGAAPMIVIIKPDGTIDGAIAASTGGTSCQTTSATPITLRGNSFGGSANGFCSIPGVGICNTRLTLNGTVSGGNILASGTIIYDCPGGSVFVEYVINLTKTSGSFKSPIKGITEAISEGGALY